MKISAARGDLLAALSIMSRALSARSTLPILSSVMFKANKESLVLHSTDLEVSIRHSMDCRVEEEGCAVIVGKLLTDIVRSMPEAAVTIETTPNDEVTISCEQSKATLKTLNPEDFPKFPEVDPDKTVSLPVDVITAVIKQVSRAASRDETRPVLTGILLSIDSGKMKMVATDSYRLAVREVELDSIEEDIEVVVPSRAMEEVPKLAASQETVSLGVAENQVIFKAGPTEFVSRRIEGKFPNYNQLIPADNEMKMTVSREEILSSLKRVALFAQHNVPIRAEVRPKDSILSLSANTQDVGGAVEDLMVQAEGEDVEIAFNSAFFLDGVGASNTEEISFEAVSPLKPGVLRSVGDEEFLYILMPVRLG